MRNPPYYRRIPIKTGLFLAVLAWACPVAATVVLQSYDLNQSNTLPDGTTYGNVTLSADSASGTVTITYSVDLTKVPGPLINFGLQEVALNTDLQLSENQISAANEWDVSLGFRNLPGFGQFNIVVKADSDDRRTTETITVTGLTGTQAAIAHFTVESLDRNGRVPAEGSVYFAARETGFRGGRNTFVGGGQTPDVTDVPEPIPLLLAGCGLVLFTAAQRRKSRCRRTCR